HHARVRKHVALGMPLRLLLAVAQGLHPGKTRQEPRKIQRPVRCIRDAGKCPGCAHAAPPVSKILAPGRSWLARIGRDSQWLSESAMRVTKSARTNLKRSRTTPSSSTLM